MVIFLDISGAFSNTAIHSLVKSLASKGIMEVLVWWIHSLLSERVAEATLGEGEISKDIDSGAPEGGISTLPLCSTMLYRREQRRLYDQIIHLSVMFLQMTSIWSEPVQPFGELHYATCFEYFFEIGQTMMIEKFNKSKTQMMIFTRKCVCEWVFEYVDTFKYLGVTFENWPTWREHFKGQIKRTNKQRLHS